MIFRGSRYEKTPVVRVRRAGGEEVELLRLRVIPEREGVYFHEAGPTDRLDGLAQRYYRDPLKFFKICDASDQLDPFDVLEVGEDTLIPPDK